MPETSAKPTPLGAVFPALCCVVMCSAVCVYVQRALHPVPHSHTNPSCFVSILNVVLFLLPGASVRSWVYLWRKVIVLALFVAGSVSVSGCVSLRCFQPVMPFVVCSVFSCLVGLARNALRIESSHL